MNFLINRLVINELIVIFEESGRKWGKVAQNVKIFRKFA